MNVSRVLVTGGAGYLGSVLTLNLLETGLRVRVMDSLIFGGTALLSAFGRVGFELTKGDIRDEKAVKSALKDVDAVVNLAAIVGEPFCNLVPEVARQVNQDAVLSLLENAKLAGASRFIFASTCSNYGSNDPERYVDESDSVQPTSLYSQSKVESEKAVISKNDNGFSTCVLRFATLYGMSPRMRFDLLLNELIKEAVLSREIKIYGPSQWRPLVHVRDAASACTRVLMEASSTVEGQIFNVGSTSENYTKRALADMIAKRLPRTKVTLLEKVSDPRNYKVSFDKIHRKLKYAVEYAVSTGIDEILEAIELGVVNPAGPEYSNQDSRLRTVPVFCK